MKIASVSHLKNTLSARLKEVMAGETVMITDRRKPIAMLRPMESDHTLDSLTGLFSEGILRPPIRKLDVGAFLKMSPGRCPRSLTEAVIEERDER